MCKIILPIKPKYSRDILSGTKVFELRRNAPKRRVNQILIYETAPASMVVGIIDISKTHKLELNELWKLTKGSNSLTRKEFDEYFHNKKYGFAFEVSNFKEYKKPRSIKKYGFAYAPQGFVYAD